MPAHTGSCYRGGGDPGAQSYDARDDITFAGSPEGASIWPDFLPASDASATLAKLLDLLARSSVPLSAYVRELPAVHIARESVPTPWDRKGAVMRELVERMPPASVLLVDGVKILRDDGWVLVLPDPEEAVTLVIAEASSLGRAERVAQELAQRIRQSAR